MQRGRDPTGAERSPQPREGGRASPTRRVRGQVREHGGHAGTHGGAQTELHGPAEQTVGGGGAGPGPGALRTPTPGTVGARGGFNNRGVRANSQVMFQGVRHTGHWFMSSPPPAKEPSKAPWGSPTEDLSAHRAGPRLSPATGTEPGLVCGECLARLWMEWSWAGAGRSSEAGAGRCPRMSCLGPPARPPCLRGHWPGQLKQRRPFTSGEDKQLQEAPGRHVTLF